ncbi:MAG: hypothetical protein FWC09_03515 [Lachnospiraceae bacterium]|nr:hypothetical protein [Lachnospiraceae bacterium]
MYNNEYSEYIPLWEYLALYWMYGMIILDIIILAHVSIFPQEEKNAMSQILMCSQFGRGQLAKAKMILALLGTNIIIMLFIVSSLIGYVVAFDFDFKIPIIEDYDIIYAINSTVNTSGDLLFIMLFTFIFTANFTALFSMYISAKLNNPYLACVLLFIGCFVSLFSLNPEIGVFFALTPLGNYIVIAENLQAMFSLGSLTLTPHLLSVIITFIFICILLKKIKNIYAASGDVRPQRGLRFFL